MSVLSLLVAVAGVSLSAKAEFTPLLPLTWPTTVGPTFPQTGFVYSKGGSLWTDTGEPYTFATFNSPQLLACTQYEAEDTFRTLRAFGRAVTRTYTESIISTNVDAADAFIQGWDDEAGDWIYNEAQYVWFDQMLNLAAQYDIKLVHPVINQDYGNEDSNYSGNWGDLVRLRYNLTNYDAIKAVNWWTDPTMIASYQLILKHLLNRVNTVNGRRYGDDPTFLAIETGNEMNDGGTLPPPGNWTVAIAKYIKSLAPNLMVLDGSLSRNPESHASWAIEALQASEVDLHSYHYYGTSPPAYDYRRINRDAAYVRSYGKTYVVGEHGFYANASDFLDFYNRQKESQTAGSMVWSMRPHADNGGFLTHGEGNGIYSYHAPGWYPPPEPDFDPLELSIIHLTYQASYNLLDEPIPIYPIPYTPTLNVTESNGVTGIVWQGGAWAEHYELYNVPDGQFSWQLVNNYLYDDVDAGTLFVPLNGSNYAGQYAIRGVSVNGTTGPWSNIITVS